MHIKTGDKIEIISGKNKGQTGIIKKVNRNKGQVIIDKINLVKKHKKSNNEQEKGQILTIESPIDASNIKKI